MLYVRLWRAIDPAVITQKTTRAYASWAGIVFALWLLAWILAEAIPVFNALLGLMSALFLCWFTYGISGMLWLHMNKGKYTQDWKKMVLTALNVCFIVMGAFTCGVGVWASAEGIRDAKKGAPFSCANTDPLAGQ